MRVSGAGTLGVLHSTSRQLRSGPVRAAARAAAIMSGCHLRRALPNVCLHKIKLTKGQATGARF